MFCLGNHCRLEILEDLLEANKYYPQPLCQPLLLFFCLFVFNNLVSAAVINKSNFWDLVVTPECVRAWTWWRWKKKHLWWRLVWSPPVHSQHSSAVIATLAVFMNLQPRIKPGGIVAMGVTVVLPGSGLCCWVAVAGKRKATQMGSVRVYGGNSIKHTSPPPSGQCYSTSLYLIHHFREQSL